MNEKLEANMDLLSTMVGVKNPRKVYILNTENIYRIIKGYPEFFGEFGYQSRLKKVGIKEKNLEWRVLNEFDIIKIQTRIQSLFECFSRVRKNMVRDAIVSLSRENIKENFNDAN